MTEAERLKQIHDYLAEVAAARRIPLAEVREEWSERAAVREYLGGIRHRRNAELHAVSDALDGFAQRKRVRR